MIFGENRCKIPELTKRGIIVDDFFELEIFKNFDLCKQSIRPL